MKLLNQTGRLGLLGVLFAGVSSLGWASSILVQRPLPDNSSVNNSTGSSRSNVDWLNQGGGVAGGASGFINGDSFSLPFSPFGWVVDTISTYVVLNKPGDTPGDEFVTGSVNLYLGIDPGSVDGIGNSPQSFSLVSSSPTYTPVTYANASSACTGYLASDGVSCLPIYEVTFVTNITLASGVTYDFAADGTVQNTLTGCTGGTCGWFNMATNLALAGTAQDGSDNLYLNWWAGDLTSGYVAINSAGPSAVGPCGSPVAAVCGGWDKSTDINVLVTGTQAVPEPGTISLFGFGGLAVLVAKIRRRRSA